MAEAAWQDRVNPVTGAPYRSARLVKAEGTGAEAILVRYPAGSVTPDHNHPCAHGLMVLSGRLLTQDGTFGPGDMVWYAAGEWGSHGATAEGEVTALLFTDGPFRVDYRVTG